MNRGEVRMRANVDDVRPPKRPALETCAGRAIAVLWALWPVGLAGCHQTQGCDPSQTCACSGGGECDLGCSGDGCVQTCDSIGDTCGLVCNNDCSSKCSNAPHCTASCGAGCALECDSVSTCEFICGDSCNATCNNAPTCGIVAGAGSVITCDSVSDCTVSCGGPCHVTCNNVASCNLTCPENAAPIPCTTGEWACGAC
ncbi:MAG: hypothetical protein ABTD50_00760 [Polyangiaceae bacterium]|jgi:hypothetical protein